MQSTNARYQELLASTHRMQTQLYIDNVVYGEEKIMEGSLQTKNSLFQGDIPTVGGAVAGEISVQLLGVLSSSVARMAIPASPANGWLRGSTTWTSGATTSRPAC
mgnify:CR=1 FL=1